MRVSTDICIITLVREGQKITVPYHVDALHCHHAEKMTVMHKQPLELRSGNTSTYFACNTLAIVSSRMRRIPLFGLIVVEMALAPEAEGFLHDVVEGLRTCWLTTPFAPW